MLVCALVYWDWKREHLHGLNWSKSANLSSYHHPLPPPPLPLDLIIRCMSWASNPWVTPRVYAHLASALYLSLYISIRDPRISWTGAIFFVHPRRTQYAHLFENGARPASFHISPTLHTLSFCLGWDCENEFGFYKLNVDITRNYFVMEFKIPW